MNIEPEHLEDVVVEPPAVKVPTVVETFPVVGITCASCVRSVESLSRSLVGVLRAEVNPATATLTLEYDPLHVQPDDVATTLRQFGYDLVLEHETTTAFAIALERQYQHLEHLRKATLLAGVLTLPVVIVGMGPWHVHTVGQWVSAILTTIIIIGAGREFFVRAWSQVRARALAMDTLVALSTGIAYLWSVAATLAPSVLKQTGIEPHTYFEAAATIITFILLGKYLEHRARLKTNSALSALVVLQPQLVHRERNQHWEDVPLASIERGDTIVVLPGERIPVDGIVCGGESWVDEQLLTGESLPIVKSTGDRVYAGTLNGDGMLRIEARAVGQGTLLGSMIRAVEQAQANKPPLQQLADRIAAVFVPIVVIIALVSFALWWILAPEKASTLGVLSLVSVLIVACPCALGLATPMAVAVALGSAAKRGALVRNARSLESLAYVRHIVFDKTGTLTLGSPQVVRWQWHCTDSEQKRLAPLLAATVGASTHPLSRAIATWLGIAAHQTLRVEQVRGRGLYASNDRHTVLVGNRTFLSERNVVLPVDDSLPAHTEVLAAIDGKVILQVWLRDSVREDAVDVIQALKQQGITLHLVSGDRQEAVETLVQELGIDQAVAGALPQHKQEYIRMLRQRCAQEEGTVGMVGDGINDAQALAEADVSIALGSGSDVALHAADITIVGSRLRPLLELLALARRMRRIVVENLAWAFVYNLVLIPVAAGALYPWTGILLHPMIASVAMAASSISVVTNSLRLR